MSTPLWTPPERPDDGPQLIVRDANAGARLPVNIMRCNRNIPDEHWMPHQASEGASGFDLKAAITKSIMLYPRMRVTIPCGFAIALPPGFELQIRPRSGLAQKHGLTVLNSPGTVDSDYRGEIAVILYNTDADQYIEITPGMRIAQGVLASVLGPHFHLTTTLEPTERGAGGFGSTGA